MEAIRLEFISNDMTGKNASTQGNSLKTFFEHLFTMNAGFTEYIHGTLNKRKKVNVNVC